MAMIFPGMDPYLENPMIWPSVHNRLVVYIADRLQPLLRPRYIASIDERVFVEGPDRDIIPDVWLIKTRLRGGGAAVAVMEEDAPVVVRVGSLEIHESYIEILDRQSGQRVVTVIEVVSPTNKFAGPGRNLYLKKQQEVRSSNAHLVEIDLLRAGTHVLAVPESSIRGQGDYDYLISVNRAAGLREEFVCYPCQLRRPLRKVKIPLADDDPDVVLDLQAVLAQTYEAGSYRDRINYSALCRPPLTAEDQEWANQLIAGAPANGV